MRFLYLSPASRYALLGMRALGRSKAPGRFKLVGDLAREGRVPANMLAKIFQRLARRGLLESQRGPGGGYALTRPAREISLADIVRAVQDLIEGGHHCLLRNRLCRDGKFCLIHDVIIKADELLIAGFEGLSLEDLATSEGWT